MEFKNLLKILAKFGYPGDSTLTIMSSVDYDPYNFLSDLMNEFGEEKFYKFINKTLSKLSSGTHSDINIKIPLSNYFEKGSYIYLIIHDFSYSPDNDESSIEIAYSWGDNKIITPEGETTLEEMSDEMGLGEMGEWQDMMDDIRAECNNYIRTYCGFNIWF
jgi:hypothetical protein